MEEDPRYEVIEARHDRNVEALKAYLAETPGAVFAGFLLEPETGLTWVGFVGDADLHERALRERVSEPDGLRVFAGSHSAEQLERINEAIGADDQLWEEYGVVSAGTDLAANRVEVLANPPVSPELIESMRKRFGDAVVVEEGTVEPA